MAQETLTLTFLTLTLLSTSSSHSQLLDISSALRLTRQVFERPSLLHHHHQTRLSTTTSTNSNSSNSLSLVLRPHISNLADFNHNYTALVLSRLKHDEARFVRLTSATKLQAPITSGLASQEYFVQFGVGTPARVLSLEADTGSDITWVQCQPCYKCYQQSDPLFDPNSSSTYNPVPCSSPLCATEYTSCSNDVCTYGVNYGDGSNSTGNFATETMSFGSSGSVNDVAFGCGTDNEGMSVGSEGLMGLGSGALSFPSQINATSFSYCLVNRDSSSSSTLDFNSPPPADSIVAQMFINVGGTSYWYVDFTGISVAGIMVGVPAGTFEIGKDGSGGVFVDSGTTVTRFPEGVYDMVRDAFKSVTQNWTPANGVGAFDTCYDLSGGQSTMVPPVSFHFERGGMLTLPPGNTVIPVDNAGTFCFAFSTTFDATATRSIIGNVQQQGIRVTYDLANRLFGFSQNKC